MHSFAVYQIIATLATLALLTLPNGAEALPVRGALGSLNTRARVARRAAAHSHNTPALEKRFKMATSKEANALPVNPKQQILSKVKTVKDVDTVVNGAAKKNLPLKRDTGLVVDAASSPISSPVASPKIAPGANNMALGLVRPSAVIRQNIVAPAAILAAQDTASSYDEASSEESESSEISSSPSIDAEAVYQSYIDQLNDSITATVTVTSTTLAAAPTNFKIAAVVPEQSSPAAVTPDAEAIYNSYVAQMNAAAASSS